MPIAGPNHMKISLCVYLLPEIVCPFRMKHNTIPIHAPGDQAKWILSDQIS